MVYETIPEYFRMSKDKPELSYYPADFRVNQLSRVPRINAVTATEGAFCYSLDWGGETHSVTICIGKMLSGGSKYLRAMIARTTSGKDRDKGEALVMEGSPLPGGINFAARGIRRLSEEGVYKDTTDRCLRILAGFINIWQDTNVIDHGIINVENLVRFMSAESLPLIMGSVLTDPINGYKTLMDAILRTEEPFLMDVTPWELWDALYETEAALPRDEPNFSGYPHSFFGGEGAVNFPIGVDYSRDALNHGYPLNREDLYSPSDDEDLSILEFSRKLMTVTPVLGRTMCLGLMDQNKSTRLKFRALCKRVSYNANHFWGEPLIGFPLSSNGCYYLPLIGLSGDSLGSTEQDRVSVIDDIFNDD